MEDEVKTLQIQTEAPKEKTLPLNDSELKGSAYCNGRTSSASGAGPCPHNDDVRDSHNGNAPASQTELRNACNGASLLLRLTAVAVALTTWTPSSTASASTGSSPALNTQNAVNAIIGEAEAEPMAGKIAVAEVIRRRGSLRGIYGIHSPRVRMASPAVRKDCELAWATKGTNLTRGATVWGSASDVAKWKARAKKYPRHWFNRMEQTAQIAGHFFFAERKSK